MSDGEMYVNVQLITMHAGFVPSSSELPGRSSEGSVAIIDLRRNHRSAHSNLQQILERNLSPPITSHQQEVINELDVYACI